MPIHAIHQSRVKATKALELGTVSGLLSGFHEVVHFEC
jgi:hypothetical protein